MRTLALIALLFVATQARAELYAAFGWARVDSDRPGFNRPDLVDIGAAPTGTANGTDTIPVAFGYQFRRWFALEASYLDASDMHKTNNSVRSAADPLSIGNHTREWSFKAVGLSGVGSFWVTERWAAVLKGSLHHVTAEFRSSTHVTRPDLSPIQVLVQESSTVRNREWIPAVGVGIAYVNKPLGARLIYERFANNTGLYGAGNDLSAVKSLSLQAMVFF
jgi:hypothetical protein